MWTWSPSAVSPSSVQRPIVSAACSGVSPNFEPRWPVCDRPVRVGVDSRRHANEHPLDARGGRPLRVVGRVEDDEAARLRAGAQLLVRLVVAVEHERVSADPGGARIRELAERRRLRAETLVAEQRQHGDVRESLDAVEDGRLRRRLAVRPCPRTQGLLAVDDERGAVRLGERARAEPAEDELAALDPRGVGKEIEHGQFFGSRKPTYQCVPSQNGLFFDWPQRQSAKCSREGPWSPRGWSSSTAPVT